MSDAMLKEIKPWDWKIRSQQFYKLFRKLIEDAEHAGKYKPTVCVS